MMAAQPPSLPYIRDEASTSHQVQQVSYPAYPHDDYDHDIDMDGELDDEDVDNVHAFQFWTAKRHLGRKGKSRADEETALPWRLRSRLKTVNAGLFLCLNIGVDPPDIVKTNPCAKTECWVDPTTLPSNKAIEAIGRSGFVSWLHRDVDHNQTFNNNMKRSTQRSGTSWYVVACRAVAHYSAWTRPSRRPKRCASTFARTHARSVHCSITTAMECQSLQTEERSGYSTRVSRWHGPLCLPPGFVGQL